MSDTRIPKTSPNGQNDTDTDTDAFLESIEKDVVEVLRGKEQEKLSNTQIAKGQLVGASGAADKIAARNIAGIGAGAGAQNRQQQQQFQPQQNEKDKIRLTCFAWGTLASEPETFKVSVDHNTSVSRLKKSIRRKIQKCLSLPEDTNNSKEKENVLDENKSHKKKLQKEMENGDQVGRDDDGDNEQDGGGDEEDIILYRVNGMLSVSDIVFHALSAHTEPISPKLPEPDRHARADTNTSTSTATSAAGRSRSITPLSVLSSRSATASVASSITMVDECAPASLNAPSSAHLHHFHLLARSRTNRTASSATFPRVQSVNRGRFRSTPDALESAGVLTRLDQNHHYRVAKYLDLSAIAAESSSLLSPPSFTGTFGTRSGPADAVHLLVVVANGISAVMERSKSIRKKKDARSSSAHGKSSGNQTGNVRDRPRSKSTTATRRLTPFAIPAVLESDKHQRLPPHPQRRDVFSSSSSVMITASQSPSTPVQPPPLQLVIPDSPQQSSGLPTPVTPLAALSDDPLTFESTKQETFDCIAVRGLPSPPPTAPLPPLITGFVSPLATSVKGFSSGLPISVTDPVADAIRPTSSPVTTMEALNCDQPLTERGAVQATAVPSLSRPVIDPEIPALSKASETNVTDDDATIVPASILNTVVTARNAFKPFEPEQILIRVGDFIKIVKVLGSPYEEDSHNGLYSENPLDGSVAQTDQYDEGVTWRARDSTYGCGPASLSLPHGASGADIEEVADPFKDWDNRSDQGLRATEVVRWVYGVNLTTGRSGVFPMECARHSVPSEWTDITKTLLPEEKEARHGKPTGRTPTEGEHGRAATTITVSVKSSQTQRMNACVGIGFTREDYCEDGKDFRIEAGGKQETTENKGEVGDDLVEEVAGQETLEGREDEKEIEGFQKDGKEEVDKDNSKDYDFEGLELDRKSAQHLPTLPSTDTITTHTESSTTTPIPSIHAHTLEHSTVTLVTPDSATDTDTDVGVEVRFLSSGASTLRQSSSRSHPTSTSALSRSLVSYQLRHGSLVSSQHHQSPGGSHQGSRHGSHLIRSHHASAAASAVSRGSALEVSPLVSMSPLKSGVPQHAVEVTGNSDVKNDDDKANAFYDNAAITTYPVVASAFEDRNVLSLDKNGPIRNGFGVSEMQRGLVEAVGDSDVEDFEAGKGAMSDDEKFMGGDDGAFRAAGTVEMEQDGSKQKNFHLVMEEEMGAFEDDVMVVQLFDHSSSNTRASYNLQGKFGFGGNGQDNYCGRTRDGDDEDILGKKNTTGAPEEKKEKDEDEETVVRRYRQEQRLKRRRKRRNMALLIGCLLHIAVAIALAFGLYFAGKRAAGGASGAAAGAGAGDASTPIPSKNPTTDAGSGVMPSPLATPVVPSLGTLEFVRTYEKNTANTVGSVSAFSVNSIHALSEPHNRLFAGTSSGNIFEWDISSATASSTAKSINSTNGSGIGGNSTTNGSSNSRPVRTYLAAHRGPVSSVVARGDGGYRALFSAGAQDGVVKQWNTATGINLKNFTSGNGGSAIVSSMTSIFLFGDSVFVGGGGGGTIREWAAASGLLLANYPTKAVTVNNTTSSGGSTSGPFVVDVAVEPTGMYIFVSMSDGTVQQIEMGSSSIRTFGTPLGGNGATNITNNGSSTSLINVAGSSALYVLPDGRMFGISGVDGIVREYGWAGTATGARMYDSDAVASVQPTATSVFAVPKPDNYLFVGGSDGVVRMWDLENGTMLGVGESNSGGNDGVMVDAVKCLFGLEDQRRLFVGYEDGKVREFVWRKRGQTSLPPAM
ncbi:hypothetical protein HK102_000611 [Quaeritorhiza haematococci]|nr:hypothetical protein HK102_000611 [Quaeritorhiza haematococci]